MASGTTGSPNFGRRWGTRIALLLVVMATAVAAFAANGDASSIHGRVLAARTSLLTAHTASSDAVSFSHAVVVDEQRPGFEPDVKAATDGSIYTSVPYGFSTTQSFVWSSRDSGNSYQLTPGNIGPGKPTTCAGGGDTDLFLDSHNALYFSDLQGLTNISMSKSTDGGTTWTTNCAGAPNTPDDRMWYTGTGSSAGGDLVLYNDYDATDTGVSTSGAAGNQLVETVSRDGTTFLPVVNSNTSALLGDCAGVAVQDCVTDNEGISGNQVADPAHSNTSASNVYIAHTTTEGSGGEVGVRISEGHVDLSGAVPTATWTESPNLDASLCPGSAKAADGSGSCVDANGNPMELAGENFASIARDSAGYLYVAFTAGPLDHASSSDANFGALTAPEQIYVVHSLEPAPADPSKITWSAPQPITGSGESAGTNTFPWITAGSDGRVAVAYYHTPETSEQGTCASGTGTCTLYGASNLTKAEWSVQAAETLDGHDTSAAWTSFPVSEAPVKYGQICTNGIGCATGGDRSLGDYLQVTPDPQGRLLVSYVDDTSADTSAGENAGPEVISRQISGPSLYAADGNVTQGAGPGRPMGSVSDPTGDADYSANGARTPASPNLDLTGASLANGSGGTLLAKISVKDLSSLSVAPTLGGPDASWILRFTEVDPGTTGNGHIYYVGMDNAGGTGAPTFFVGDTAGLPAANSAEHTKYLTYPQTTALTAKQASYDAKTGVISFDIPLSDIGNPAPGTILYSATAFSATSLTPQSSTTLFNLIDATAPFDFVIGAPGTAPSAPAFSATGTTPAQTTGSGGPTSGGGTPGSGTNGGGTTGSGPRKGGTGATSRACPQATGALRGAALGRLRLGMTAQRAATLLRRHSGRNRRHMQFYCLRGSGIRAAYGYRSLLMALPGRHVSLSGRIVWASTSNRRYRLRGIAAGERFSRARRLHPGAPIRLGANAWYVVADGGVRGLLKVHRGVIGEIGIAEKSLTGTHAAVKRLLAAFGG